MHLRDNTFVLLMIIPSGHLFSTYAKFSEKLTCLTPPDTHTYLCVSESKKC